MPQTVSVIIPVFNGEKYLEQALQSVFAQKRRPDQVILVDDGSTDATARIARSFPDVLYLNQPNRGVSSALNLGIRSATGDLVTFLDADDFWPADTLERQCALMQQHPEKQVIIGLVQPFRLKPAGAGKPDISCIGAPVHLLNLGSALFNRSVFDRIGLMDESLAIGADWDWFLRARDEGIPMLIHPSVALFYRRHGTNLTNRQKQLEHDLLVVFKKTLDRRRLHGKARELPRFSDFIAEVKRNSLISYDPAE